MKNLCVFLFLCLSFSLQAQVKFSKKTTIQDRTTVLVSEDQQHSIIMTRVPRKHAKYAKKLGREFLVKINGVDYRFFERSDRYYLQTPDNENVISGDWFQRRFSSKEFPSLRARTNGLDGISLKTTEGETIVKVRNAFLGSRVTFDFGRSIDQALLEWAAVTYLMTFEIQCAPIIIL